MQTYKIPQSVLVVIYTPDMDVLLIKRADADDFWQSVTGAKDSPAESWEATAVREVYEETGMDARSPKCHLRDWGLENVYEIYPGWRHRYEPSVTHNTEHLLGLQVPAETPVTLNLREHTSWRWMPWREAAEACFSPSNAEACLLLPRFAQKQWTP